MSPVIPFDPVIPIVVLAAISAPVGAGTAVFGIAATFVGPVPASAVHWRSTTPGGNHAFLRWGNTESGGVAKSDRVVECVGVAVELLSIGPVGNGVDGDEPAVDRVVF